MYLSPNRILTLRLLQRLQKKRSVWYPIAPYDRVRVSACGKLIAIQITATNPMDTAAIAVWQKSFLGSSSPAYSDSPIAIERITDISEDLKQCQLLVSLRREGTSVRAVAVQVKFVSSAEIQTIQSDPFITNDSGSYKMKVLPPDEQEVHRADEGPAAPSAGSLCATNLQIDGSLLAKECA
jgi:hypothetical protein